MNAFWLQFALFLLFFCTFLSYFGGSENYYFLLGWIFSRENTLHTTTRQFLCVCLFNHSFVCRCLAWCGFFHLIYHLNNEHQATSFDFHIINFTMSIENECLWKRIKASNVYLKYSLNCRLWLWLLFAKLNILHFWVKDCY